MDENDGDVQFDDLVEVFNAEAPTKVARLMPSRKTSANVSVLDISECGIHAGLSVSICSGNNVLMRQRDRTMSVSC